MPRPVEGVQIWDSRLVVLGPGGEDDRAAENLLSVVKRYFVRPLIAAQIYDGAGDHDLGAELLRLCDGSVGQFMP